MFDINNEAKDSPEALAGLYRDAFPDEDLVPLVHRLAAGEGRASAFSAFAEEMLLGNLYITPCGLPDEEIAYLLGPVAVSSKHQRAGVGTALIHASLEYAKANRAVGMLVLGDPAYYGRHGFQTESLVKPPYDLPEAWQEAWQSIWFDRRGTGGRVIVPDVWAAKSLWLP